MSPEAFHLAALVGLALLSLIGAAIWTRADVRKRATGRAERKD
jgi:hypothetical protein